MKKFHVESGLIYVIDGSNKVLAEDQRDAIELLPDSAFDNEGKQKDGTYDIPVPEGVEVRQLQLKPNVWEDLGDDRGYVWELLPPENKRTIYRPLNQ